MTRPESWKQAVAEILARHHRLDVLVNNAGSHQDAFLAMMPPDAWQRVLATNLDGVFHGCQAVLPTMISQRSGRIVNVASLSALLAPAGQTNYAAAKAGVVALTQSLAKEVGRIGITVNAVCPGYVDTEALAPWAKLSAVAPWSGFRCGDLGSPAKLPRRSVFWLAPEQGTSQAPRSKLTAEFFNEQPGGT